MLQGERDRVRKEREVRNGYVSCERRQTRAAPSWGGLNRSQQTTAILMLLFGGCGSCKGRNISERGLPSADRRRRQSAHINHIYLLLLSIGHDLLDDVANKREHPSLAAEQQRSQCATQWLPDFLCFRTVS